MDAKKPAAYGQCPHRAGRQARPQPPVVQRASAAALSQHRPAPAMNPAAQPAARPAPPPPPPAQPKRAWLSAYAKDFTVAIDEGGQKAPLPVEAQRAEGGMVIADGITTAPEDGYYMLLWELGVGGAQGEATLQLGINEAASQLTYALHPGYDSGQQVTWLSAGDRVGLFIQSEDAEARAEAQCTSAQFTVIRLG